MEDATFIRECNRLVPLGPWLELCQEARVPHIPAEFSEPFPFAQVYGALDGEECPELAAAWEWMRRRVGESLASGDKVMVRWECACHDRVKSAACQGFGWSEELYCSPMTDGLCGMCDDMRGPDCTVTETTRLGVRPWVDALRFDGWPVEFRVFYGPNGYQGVSNYYPQRPLPDMPLYRELAHDCHVMAGNLSTCSQRFPAGFTADFLVKPDGDVLFLEGGPPSHGHPMAPNAHPCCMAPGKIRGVALAPREGALRG